MTGLHSPFAIPNPIDVRAGIVRPRLLLNPAGAAIPFLSCGGCAARNAAGSSEPALSGRTSFLPLGLPLSGQAPAGASASAFLFQ